MTKDSQRLQINGVYNEMGWMIKNSKGKEDAMLTFALIGFIIVSICVILSMVKGIMFKSFSLELTPPDNTLLLGYLASTLGAYVARRNKEHSAEKKE